MDQQQKKVVIELHEREKISTKIWHFLNGRQYTKDEVEAEVSSLFPQIVKKGFHLNLFYYDDLAGEVHIESDGDMQQALQFFLEEWDNERRKEYLVLHAEDCCPMQPESTSAADTYECPSNSQKVYACIVCLLYTSDAADE